jgi:hypothetical protein
MPTDACTAMAAANVAQSTQEFRNGEYYVAQPGHPEQRTTQAWLFGKRSPYASVLLFAPKHAGDFLRSLSKGKTGYAVGIVQPSAELLPRESSVLRDLQRKWGLTQAERVVCPFFRGRKRNQFPRD